MPFRLDELRHFYRFRSDEIFRRVNIRALLTLMLEQAKLEMQVKKRRSIVFYSHTWDHPLPRMLPTHGLSTQQSTDEWATEWRLGPNMGFWFQPKVQALSSSVGDHPAWPVLQVLEYNFWAVINVNFVDVGIRSQIFGRNWEFGIGKHRQKSHSAVQ